MSEHFNTRPGLPQTKAEVDALGLADLRGFMAMCDAEPADFDGCLSCYAYLVVQMREEGAKATDQLLRDMKALMDRTDLAEAAGLVVAIYDPETGRTDHHGPFPKDDDGKAAMAWMEAHLTGFNESNVNDGPPLKGTVHLLFAPER